MYNNVQSHTTHSFANVHCLTTSSISSVLHHQANVLEHEYSGLMMTDLEGELIAR